MLPRSPLSLSITYELVNLRPFFNLAKKAKLSSRRLSSRRGDNSGKRFQLDALPFTVSPDDAYKKFESWAVNEQGLGPLLSAGLSIGWASVSIIPAYAPFWYFSLNIRFDGTSPEPFRSAYTRTPNGVIHIPGLASYAGFSYRRSLIDPIHNTTLVFKNDSIVPFGSWMLNPLKFQAKGLEVCVDPWNATRARAFSIIHDELYEMANDESKAREVKIEIERLSSRRIYMPTYVVEYDILGIKYRAFLSGCDSSVEVSGVSHKTIFATGGQADQVFRGATSFMSHRAAPIAASVFQFFGFRPFVAIGQLFWGFVSRVAMKFHIIGILGGGTVLVWRKFVRPYLDDRAASAEWERQRDHEAQMEDSQIKYNEFRDDGSAELFFSRNRQRILRHLRGQEKRKEESGTQDWYAQWEEWAKEQWENAQKETYRNQKEWYRQNQEKSWSSTQRQRSNRERPKEEPKWDFNPDDPFSVLGIDRSATKDEVAKAFRREMLKHHPDTMPGATEAEKKRATERSKLISDAYRKIKGGQRK